MQYKAGISVVIVLAILMAGLSLVKSENDSETVFFTWEKENNGIHFFALLNGNNYTWQFGDGSIGYGKVVSHEYAANGKYSVKLLVNGNVADEREISTGDEPPQANFYWEPLTPHSYQKVIFIDNSTDSDGYIINWSWDIGNDGIIDGYGKYMEYTFKTPGSHDVTLRVIDNDGRMDAVTKQITVINLLPVPKFYWTKVNDSILFNASWSYDRDGSVTNYTWQFGDGSIGYGKVVSHEYAASKSYNVILTVRDDYGETNSTSMAVNTLNNPPAASFYWEPLQPTDLEIVSFYSTSNDSDGVIINYTWQFGDGSVAYARNVSHKYADNGKYNVTLFVLDNEGAYDVMKKEIVVSNVPPVVNFTYSPSFPLPNKNITFEALCYDRDGVIINYTWQFGDGSIAYGSIVNHSYATHGIYLVNLTVTDNDGAKDTKKLKIVVADFYVDSIYDPANHTWTKIQDAVDNATNGSFIYVMKGWYNEIVRVNKSVYILGKNASVNSFILGSNIFIENFEIKKAKNGVVLKGNGSAIKRCKFYENNVSINISGNYNEIVDNNITNGIGIFIKGNNNMVENNTIYGEYGIKIYGEMNEIIRNNISSKYGICLYHDNNFIASNSIHGCEYGMMAYDDSFIENNSFYNNSYAIYGTNFSLQACRIWNNSHGIKGENVSIKNCILSHNKVGIEANYSTIYNSTLDGYINVSMLSSWNNIYSNTNINSNMLSNKDKIIKSYMKGRVAAINTTINESMATADESIFKNCAFNDSYVTVSDTSIKNCSFVKSNLILKDGNIITNCSFMENEYAIKIEGSKNIISYNKIWKNEEGIEIDGNKNRIWNNTIEGNENGLKISSSSYNKFLNNTFLNNKYAIYIYGEERNHFYHEFEGNSINGLPIFYLINGSNISINKRYGFIGLISCKNISIENQSISGNGDAILLFDCKNVEIKNSSVFENINGIYIKKSVATLKNLEIYNNSHGISFVSSYDNIVENCNIFSNDIGVKIFDIEKSNGGNEIKSKFYGNRIGILIQNQGGSRVYGSIDCIEIDHSSNNILKGNASKIVLRYGGIDIDSSTIKIMKSHNSEIEISNARIYNISMNKGSIEIYESILNGKMMVNEGYASIGFSKIKAANISILGAFANIYNSNISNNSYIYINGSGNISNSNFFGNKIGIKIDGNITIWNSSFYDNRIGAYLMNGMMKKGKINNNTYGCIAYGGKISGILFHHNKIALLLNGSSIITRNSFWKNDNGIIANGNGSKIYCNNFVYNNRDAIDNGNNTWNESEGNYWDDYAGVDKNNDGIGDIPYPVSESYDWRPLMAACVYAAPMPNEKPVAKFIYYPASPRSFDEISFIDKSSDPNGEKDIKSWYWNFGDGGVAYERNPKHAYEKPGKYNVILRVRDRAGSESTYNITINVSNLPPIANFTYTPKNATSYTLIKFEALCYDRDGVITNYTWQFGDGSIGYGSIVNHSYATHGIYLVNLTIRDDLNATSSYVKTIKIGNRPPSASFEFYPESPATGEEISFVDDSTDTDGNIIEWHWDFGDGTASNERNATHTYVKPGTYKVKLTVKDDGGSTSTYEKVIEIKEKETPGMGIISLIIALGLILIMRKFK